MRKSLGYHGSPGFTLAEMFTWLASTSRSPISNGAWDFYCQGLARASISACAANPFNGNTNIYDPGTTWSDLWLGLKASPKLALIMIAVESPVFGAPELSTGEDLAAGAAAAGAEGSRLTPAVMGEGMSSRVIPYAEERGYI